MSLWRSRWAAIGAAVAVAMGGGGIGLVSAGVSSGERPVTVTIEPKRILDTRVDLGLPGRFVNETPRDLQVTGNVPIAPSGTETVVPADAVAVLVNVTIVGPDSSGFLSLRPGGAAGKPATSTVNFTAGSIEPNAATVDLGPGGTVQVFVKTADAAGTADVLVDVVGYTVDHDHDDRYYTEGEVDALVDSIPEGPEGPQGPPGPSSADYENVIVVAKSGGDFDSVTGAMNAIGSDPEYPAASVSNRYLVWVAPGEYDDEDIDMQSYVDIEGSGQGVTVLRSVGGTGGLSPDSATLVGAASAELRHVTVEIEAADPGHWTHAIYTDSNTTFRNVTAVSTGGSRTRGIVVATGGSPVMVDVIVVANDGSTSNLGVDLFGATAFADGLFARASGGTVATGILLNNTSSEVQFENVTTHATGATSQAVGVNLTGASATLEGLRSTVTSEAGTVYGVSCVGAGEFVNVLDATLYVDSSPGVGSAFGVSVSNCSVELRSAAVDAVAAGGSAFGVSHLQADDTDAANVTISDVELRSESGGSSALGMYLYSSGATPAGTFGRVSDTNIRATGGSEGSNTYAIRHAAAGDVQYRGLSLISGGAANFLYGIQTIGDGTPRFDDVVIDAIGEAESTVFGVEFHTDSTTMTNARVAAVNFDTGTFHDAVGVKANNASGVVFTDVTAYAEAEFNTWGADLSGSETRLVRADLSAASTSTGTSLGARCAGGSSNIHDSIMLGSAATSSSYGLLSWDCDSKVTGSELIGSGSGTNSGLYAESTSGSSTTTVRGSYLAGSSFSVLSGGVGVATVLISGSQLDGGTGSTTGAMTVQECTAVTYNSGGSEMFQSGTSDPCP